jgi:UrcA family protein
MRRSVFALIGFGLFSIAAPAAADNDNLIQVRVPVTEADLQSPEAVAALYARVQEAGMAVCREAMRSSLPYYVSTAQCRREVVENAIAETGVEAVARHHATVTNPQLADQTTIAAR